MTLLNFPWDYIANDDTKEVWVHIPGGYPSVLGLPSAITRFFPGYTATICTYSHLQSLKTHE